MGKYYRISLNCARVRTIESFSNDYGFINVMPLKGTVEKKGLFGVKYIPVTKYEGRFSVIAEQIDDHFEDIVLGKRIDFDPNGIRDITTASFEDLLNNLKRGLTCYNMIEIPPEVALYYGDIIKSDINIANKYKKELVEIEKKRNVVQELIYRMDLEEANQNSKNKKKVLKIKSA